MRIVFMGTPEFAANILTELVEQHEVVAVYTRADAVRARGKALVASPVKEFAASRGIAVHTPSTLRDDAEIAALRALEPDAICVAAYGMILPQAVLDIPPYGCLNVHASLLPQYRGAAPIERAILDGQREAGVCIMRMEAGLDTGDYCVSRSIEIGDMNAHALETELADMGARALLSALFALERGQARWIAQDEAQATYAAKLEKGELDLAPGDSAICNLRRVRASGANHPSKCAIAGKPVTICQAWEVSSGDELFGLVQTLGQGQVAFTAKRLFLGCAQGVLEIGALKPDGKKEMSAAAFASGIQGMKNNDKAWEHI